MNRSAVAIQLQGLRIESRAIKTRKQFLGVTKEDNMKPSTQDQAEGRLHEVKGAVKEKAGQLTKNPDLETEGKVEKFGGKVQKKVGEIEKVLEK